MDSISNKVNNISEKLNNIKAYVDQRIDSFENDLDVLESRINNLR